MRDRGGPPWVARAIVRGRRKIPKPPGSFPGLSAPGVSARQSRFERAQLIYGFKSAVCAIAAILLAKERLILFMGGLLYVAVQLAWALRIAHNWTDWRVPLGLLVSGGLVVLISAIAYRSGWKPSYTWPKKIYILDILVGLASLGGTIALIRWMKP